MGLPAIILGISLPAAALLSAVLAVVAHRTFARRRTAVRNFTEGGDEKRERQFRRSIPAALSLVHSQLNELAENVDEELPRQFRLIDRLIDESDREIARLQRRLATAGSASVSLSRREPDVLPLGDFQPRRIAVPAVPHFGDRTNRRAA